MKKKSRLGSLGVRRTTKKARREVQKKAGLPGVRGPAMRAASEETKGINKLELLAGLSCYWAGIKGMGWLSWQHCCWRKGSRSKAGCCWAGCKKARQS